MSEPRIIKPELRDFAFMNAHRTNVGDGVPNELLYLSNERVNPGGEMFTAYRRLHAVDEAEAHVYPHKHTVDQLYCWVGDNEDFTGLKVEVCLGDEVTLVESPCSVNIPAGTLHWHRYVSGSGHFIGVLVTHGKSYNDVTPMEPN